MMPLKKAVKAVLVNQFQGRSSFSTWVASLGVNIALDYSLKTRQESQVIVGSLKGNQGDRRQ